MNILITRHVYDISNVHCVQRWYPREAIQTNSNSLLSNAATLCLSSQLCYHVSIAQWVFFKFSNVNKKIVDITELIYY